MKVIFVHGIGATGQVWDKTQEIVGQHYKCSAITFKDRFGSPDQQVEELKDFLDQHKKEDLILVCHSLGGLVARKYLTLHPHNARIKKIIFLGVPNQGIFGLIFNWIPLAIEIIVSLIALAAENYSLLWLVLLAAGYDFFSYLRGVKLISPAASALKPHSKFIKDLNSKNLPVHIQYTVLLSRPWYHLRGDGAVSIESQKLSYVPNFKDLNYKEIPITVPHFKEPQAAEAILAALR